MEKENNSDKKKIIIIGAGIAGLTAGIYCLDNGFNVEIYEKHSIPGGECTGWTRRGQYIDGCAHWIVGTGKCSDLHPLWEHIGAFDGDPKIYETDYITKFALDDGRIFTFYSDLCKLKKEMMHFFPEDKHNINSFITAVKCYQHIRVPAKKPLDFMNPFEYIAFGIRMFPALFPFLHYKHVSVEEYIQKFKNKELGEIINRFMESNYNIHSFMYICQAVSKKDAGMIEGGSVKLVQRVVSKFKDLGGKLHLNSPVDKIITEDDKAKGILLSNGEEHFADYVIASCDAYHTLYHLLDGKYKDKIFDRQFKDAISNPINTSVMIAYRTKKDMIASPKMLDFKIDEFDMFGKKTNHFCVRNFAFDKTLPSHDGQTLLTVLLPANEDVYNNLKAMPSKEYQAKKKELGNLIMGYIKEKMDIADSDIELIDVTTPLTYERYTNAYMGSYMSFMTTKFTKGLMRPGIIDGLSNFVIAGQWIMPPGGLPIALISGKHACQRICKFEKKKFINKERSKTPSKTLKKAANPA